ncbi:DUF2975 domain-containing protein [Virgibacillus flavescens]|uniref:DUF2975 domain-containing protein n=1 Tax=Virgibacillus flavescens TaxID=1611422 RepID=UPI003D33247A
MKRGSTLFLKITVILMGIPILALCIFVVPAIAKFAGELYPDMAAIKYIVVIGMYAASLFFYLALYQALRLLSFIDRNEAFSELSVGSLKVIRNCAIVIGSLFVFNLPLIIHMAHVDDAPGLAAIGMVIIFASFVIAVFAAVLQKLVRNAIDIKSENELTV